MKKRQERAGDRPKLSANRILVALGPKPDQNLRIASRFGVGAEVQTFADPGILARDFSGLLKSVAKATHNLEGPIGCHGAFFDTVHYSLDSMMMDVARVRYLQSLEIAAVLKAKYVVFHSQYDPIIKVRKYRDIYHRQSMKFWPAIIREAEQMRIPIVIENMFDDSPAPIRRLCDEFRSPYFRVCLDIAHTVVWSKIDIAEWITTLAPYLMVTHLTDCDGEYDDHLGLGTGSMDIDRCLALLKKANGKLYHVLETHDHMQTSLKYLRLALR